MQPLGLHWLRHSVSLLVGGPDGIDATSVWLVCFANIMAAGILAAEFTYSGTGIFQPLAVRTREQSEKNREVRMDRVKAESG